MKFTISVSAPDWQWQRVPTRASAPQWTGVERRDELHRAVYAGTLNTEGILHAIFGDRLLWFALSDMWEQGVYLLVRVWLKVLRSQTWLNGL